MVEKNYQLTLPTDTYPKYMSFGAQVKYRVHQDHSFTITI